MTTPSAPSQDLVSLFRTLGQPTDELPQGHTLGRFTVEAKIGAGGMGTVYAAQDSELRRRVALKLLHPRSGQTEADLLVEAQRLARLNHPNVVTVYEANATDGRVWISMEYIEGETLSAWQRKRARSWEEVLAVMLPIGHGLAAAHAAGLAHGDLKPGNIMIGSDDRPRILDFGLAREKTATHSTQAGVAEPDSLPAAAGPIGPETRVTEIGGGTPGYMAPEQRHQTRADELTDQFSYCVTFWELLFGERPSTNSPPTGDTPTAPVPAIPAGVRVPGWLIDPIRRGLSIDRRKRWPGIPSLLEALARGPIDSQRRRSRWRLAGVGLAGLGVGIVVATLLGLQVASLVAESRRQRRCEAEARTLESIWDDDVKNKARQAILATGVTYAEPVANYTLTAMDDYLAELRNTSTQICLESRGEDGILDQSNARAQWCLAERRTRASAAIELYITADDAVTRNAALVADDLPPPSDCTTNSYLEGHPAPRLQQLSNVQAIQQKLSEAHRNLILARPKEALQDAESVRSRAIFTGWRPLIAAVDYAAGQAYEGLGQYQRSAFHLEQSFREAAISNDRVRMADAAIQLIYVSSNMLTRYSEARKWAWFAEIPLATLEPSGGLRSVYRLHHLAGIDEIEGDYPRAAKLWREAIATDARILGEDNPKLAGLFNNLGNTLHFSGDLTGSRAAYERAVQLNELIGGPRHPELVSSLIGLGNVAEQLGQRSTALLSLERARSIAEESLGPGNSLAQCLNSLGAIEEDSEKARGLFMRALEIRAKILPPTHPEIAKTINNLAVLAYRDGSYPEALKTWQRVAALQRQTLGAGHPDIALTLLNLSAVQLALGHLAEARASAAHAIEIWRGADLGDLPTIGLVLVNLASISMQEKNIAAARGFALAALEHLQRVLGPEHIEVAHAMIALGEVELAAHRPAAAVDPATRALALRSAAEAPDKALVGHAQFLLARALWDSPPGRGRDRPRARALATEALAAYQVISATRPELVEINGWLVDHRTK